MGKTNQELVAQAASLRDEATGLLNEHGLLSGIADHGPTEVIGSYALDLMTWRDLDINGQLPDERDIATFFEIGDAIANRFETIRAFYSNMFIRTDQDFQSGLYWGIRLLHDYFIKNRRGRSIFGATASENTTRRWPTSRGCARL